MKNRLFAIGAMILMMTSCTQDELISSDNGKEPATAGSCLTLVGLSSPQTRVSIGDKTGDVYPVLWSEGDALGVFSRTAGTDINNVQSLLSDESIGHHYTHWFHPLTEGTAEKHDAFVEHDGKGLRKCKGYR